MVTALYGGSFDPFHLGHLSVVELAAESFDAVYVVVLANSQKSSGMFPRSQRAALVSQSTRHLPNVSVHEYHGLIVDAATELGADVLLRSAHKEGQHERSMAATNERLTGIPLDRSRSPAESTQRLKSPPCQDRTVLEAPRWNSNLHALEILLEQVPDGAETGLDVGCGEGETSRRLGQRVPRVVGIDCDAASIAVARDRNDDIQYILGDFLAEDLDQRFDVVTSVAMLHHVDHTSALTRMAGLVRPGGVLLVVGLAKSRSVGDFARDAWDTVAVRRHTLTNRVWETTAPIVWPPPLSHGQVRAATLSVLPDANVRRVPYFRYGLTWRCPL